MNDLITVVVPCYNIELFVKECLDSIISQTYTNMQIIIVDDGSTDNTGDIIDKYKFDDRVEIVKQKNAGLSAARNVGIKKAKGEYICFIDGDDYIDSNYLAIMHEKIVSSDSDICACNFNYFYDNSRKTSGYNRCKTTKQYSNIEALKDIMSEIQETGVMAWNKLYKTSLFKDNSIEYPVGKINEDNFTTYKLYYYSNAIIYVPNILYFYRQRNNSIMKSAFTNKRLDVLEAIRQSREFLRQKHLLPLLNGYIDGYEMVTQIYVLNQMIKGDYQGKEKHQLITTIKNSRHKALANKTLSKKIKTMVSLLSFSDKLYQIIIRTIK